MGTAAAPMAPATVSSAPGSMVTGGMSESPPSEILVFTCVVL